MEGSSSDRKKLEELKRILSEERQTHKKTIGKLQKEVTKLRCASPYGAVASEERASLLRELERERMMRVGAERRMQGMQLESDTCRARLVALQEECRKMEEMVANMLQYKAKVDQLKQENASMKSSYEANLQKYCSHISSLERDNMVLRNQVKKMESQIHGKGDERDKSKLLLERLKMVEAENSSLVLENEQQRQQYEKCLDEIANQVVQALLAQKMLREECFKLQSRVQDLELQNKHLNMMFQQRMKMPADSVYGLNSSDSPTSNGAGEINLDYLATAGSLHSMCSEIMGDDSPGKPQLSSPPPWLMEKLMMLPLSASARSAAGGGTGVRGGGGGAGGSGTNTNPIASSSSPDSLTSSSQQSTVESVERIKQTTKIETEFPATNASPKMKHIPVGDRRSRSLERGSFGPFSWMKRMGKGGPRSRRGSETHERSDYDVDADTTPRQRLKQSTSADALTHFGVGNKKSKSKSASSSTSSNNKLSQSMDNSDWKDSLTPERLNAKGAKLLLRTTSADLDTEKSKNKKAAICDVNHKSFEAFNKSFEKLLAKNSKEDNDVLNTSKGKLSSINVKQECVNDNHKNNTSATSQTATQGRSTATTKQGTNSSSSKNTKSSTKDHKSPEESGSSKSNAKVNQSTSTTSDSSSKKQLQPQQQHQFQQQQQQQHQQSRSNKSTKNNVAASSSSSQALRNPFAEPSSAARSPHSSKSPSPLPGQYYYYDYSDEDSDSRPVSRDFSTASTMSLNEILDSSQEAEVALDDDFFSDWSSVCISPQKRIDKLTGQTISNNALVSAARGASSSSSSSSSKLSTSSSPDSPRNIHLYKAFVNINKQQQQQQHQHQQGTRDDLLQHFQHGFSNATQTGKPEPIYDEPYIPEHDPTAHLDTETPLSAPIMSKTVSQKAVTRSLTDPSCASSAIAAKSPFNNNNNNGSKIQTPNITEVKAEVHTENFHRCPSSTSSSFQPSPSLSPNPSQISQDLGYASKGSYHSQSSPSPSPSLPHRGTPPWLHNTKDPHSFSRNELLSLVINRDAMTGSPRFIPNTTSPSSESPTKSVSRPGQLILAPQDKNFNFQGGFSSVSSTSSSEDKSPIKMFESKNAMNKMESSVIEVKKDVASSVTSPSSGSASSTASTFHNQQQNSNVSNNDESGDLKGANITDGASFSGHMSLPTSPILKSPTSKIPPPVARKPVRAVKPETRTRTPSTDNNTLVQAVPSSNPRDKSNNDNSNSKNFPGSGNTDVTVGYVLQDNNPTPITNTQKLDTLLIDNVIKNITAKDSAKFIQDSPSKSQYRHHHHHHHTHQPNKQSDFSSPSHHTKICPSSDSSFENLRVERSGSKDDGYSTMSSDIHPEILEKFCDTSLTLKRSETNTEAHFALNLNNKTGSLKIKNSSNSMNHHRAMLERRNSDSVLQQSNNTRDRSFDNLISDQDSAMETSVHSTTAEMVTSSCSSQISMSSTDLASPTYLTNTISKMPSADNFIPSSASSVSGQCVTSSPKRSLISRSSTDVSKIPTTNSNSASVENCNDSNNKVSKIARLFEKGSNNTTSTSATKIKSPTTKSPSSPRHFFPTPSSNNYHQQPESPRRLANEFAKNNQNNPSATNTVTNGSSTNTVTKKTTSSKSPSSASSTSPVTSKNTSIAKKTSASATSEDKSAKISQQTTTRQQHESRIPQSHWTSTTPKPQAASSSNKSTTPTKSTDVKSYKIPNKKNDAKTVSPTSNKTQEKQKLTENRRSTCSLDKLKSKKSKEGQGGEKSNSKTISPSLVKNASVASKKNIDDESSSVDVSTEFTLVLNPKSQDPRTGGVVLELVKGKSNSNESSDGVNRCPPFKDSTADAEFSVVLDKTGKVDTIISEKTNESSDNVTTKNEALSESNFVSGGQSHCDKCNSSKSDKKDDLCTCNSSSERRSLQRKPQSVKINGTSKSSSSQSKCSPSFSSSSITNNEVSTSCHAKKSLIVLTNQAFQHLSSSSSSPESDSDEEGKPRSNTLPPQYKPFPFVTKQQHQSSSSSSSSSSALCNGNSQNYTNINNDNHHEAISEQKAIPQNRYYHLPSSSLSRNTSGNDNDNTSHNEMHFDSHSLTPQIPTNTNDEPTSHYANYSIKDPAKTSFPSSMSSTVHDESKSCQHSAQTDWKFYSSNDSPMTNIPYLRRSFSDDSIRNHCSSGVLISKLSTSSTSSSDEDDIYDSSKTDSPGAPLQRSASASQLDRLHKQYWGTNQPQQQHQGNESNNEIASSSSWSFSSQHHHQNGPSSSTANSSHNNQPSTHHFQRFHGYQNVYSGHHRQQLQRHRLENYPFLTQSLRLDLSDVTELDEDASASELASTKDSLDTSTGGVTSDESPRPSNSDRNQFNSQFYSLCQLGSNKSLLSSSFESKEKLSMSMNSNENTKQDRDSMEEDEIALQEFDQISKQIASLSKTVDELNHSLSSLNSGEFEPNSETTNRAKNVSPTPGRSASVSCWGESAADGSVKTDADGYHWVDDEFYLASSSNEKLVMVRSRAKENDYVDYAAFCHEDQYGSSAMFGKSLEDKSKLDGHDMSTSSSSDDQNSSIEEDEYEVMTFPNRGSRSRSPEGQEVCMSESSTSSFDKVVYRRCRSGREESSRNVLNGDLNQKKLVRWTSEGNLNLLKTASLDMRGCKNKDDVNKRLSMPLSSIDLEKAFEGWDVEVPQGGDIETLSALRAHGPEMTSSSDDDGDSLASDIGLDHMMCQRLIGPNAVQGRDSPPSQVGLKMNQLILCYTRESSREEGDSIDLDRQVWDLSEKVDRLSENSRKIWNAAAAVLSMKGHEDDQDDVVVRMRDLAKRKSNAIGLEYEGSVGGDMVVEYAMEKNNKKPSADCGVLLEDAVDRKSTTANNNVLRVPETRDVGIDAMSRSQNSMSNSVEVLPLLDDKQKLRPGVHREYHQQHTLSSASRSRSVSPSSSSSSSLSLSMSYHNFPREDDNVDDEINDNENEQVEHRGRPRHKLQHQPKSSTPDQESNTYDDVHQLSADYQNIYNTVGNDGSLDRSGKQASLTSTIRSSHSEERNTDRDEKSAAQQSVHPNDDAGGTLNTASNNYINIDHLTSYSDFVADLEMNAISENKDKHLCHPNRPSFYHQHSHPHHHHYRHHHHPSPASPIRTITNGSLTPTSLERRNNCQTCPPIIMTHTNNSIGTNPASPPNSNDHQHLNQQLQPRHHLPQRPQTSLPFHRSRSTPTQPQESHFPHPHHIPPSPSPSSTSRNHAPYVNQTIPRLPQARIPSLPTSRPQSYPYPSATQQRQSNRNSNPPSLVFPPPPPPPAPEPSNIHEDTTSNTDPNTSPPPPPLPPRIPNHRVTRTQDGRPQVMIRPHRIQTQRSLPSSSSNQRPHSFNYSLFNQNQQSSKGNDSVIQRPRSSSLNTSHDGAGKNKTERLNNSSSCNTKRNGKNLDDSGKSIASKIPRRKLKTRRELVAMRKKSTDCAAECGGVALSSKKSLESGASRSWRDVHAKGTPLSDSSGEDNSSS